MSNISDSCRRILVIDDDSIVCEIAESILADFGWSVTHAYSPEEALARMAANSCPIVICDVHLPGDSGQLLQELRTGFPQSQIIMITGDPSVLSMRQAMKAGVYDYLLKPVQRDELLRVTEMALDKFLLMQQRDKLEQENDRYRIQLEDKLGQKIDQLHDTELRYRTLFDNAVDAILLTNSKDGMITELNASASKLIGKKSFDIQGSSIRDFVGTQLDHCFETPDDDYRVWRIPELTLCDREQNEHYLNAFVNRVRLGSETLIQIVARDATNHVHLSQRADMMELELISEQRLANIGLLASGVAHNINTPLMGIYGLAQVIKMKHPDIDDIDIVITQVERITKIIRNLMWKSRQEQDIEKQDIDLNVLLQEELHFLEADMEFKHNVEKVISLAPNLPPIFGRYGDFSQSLMNVIRNALDAMHDSTNKKLCVCTSVVDDTIVISIQDSGPGIAANDLPHMFEPFFSTKPAVGKSQDGKPTGTGLGLSTVQKLLSPYGCKFDVKSEVGSGATFTFLIPIAQNQLMDQELQTQEN